MRLLLRFLGTLFIAIGVVFAVGDIARFVADDIIRFATVTDVAEMMNVGGEGFATSTTGELIGKWPVSIGCAVVGAILVIIGRKPRNWRRTA